MALINLGNLDTFLSEAKKAYGDIAVTELAKSALDEYIITIDYDLLKFDTGVTLTGGSASGVLGIGQLGLMVLGSS